MAFLKSIFFLLPLAVVAQGQRPGLESGYPDVGKMSIQERLNYYKQRERMQDSAKYRIPIVASNIAMSGETLPIAWATAVEPLSNKRKELKNPYMFFKKQRDKFNEDWEARYRQQYQAGNNPLGIDPYFINQGYNPFDENINYTTVGWFYPQGNLYDEEVKEIYNSDGIIRVSLDERILGAYMYEYHDWYKEQLAAAFKELHDNSMALPDMKFEEYYEVEPFIRNIFYIAEMSDERSAKAWDHVSVFLDLGKMSDPIDLFKKADDAQYLQKAVANAIPYYVSLHKGQAEYTYGLTPAQIAQKVFYDNENAFMTRYQGKKVPLR